MIVSSTIDKHTITQFLESVQKRHGISFNCGIGSAKTGREAAKLATKSLDKIRELRDLGKNEERILELTC
jgi:GTP cyclohydrolase IIa